MNICSKCGAGFKNHVWIMGKHKNLHNRRYCLACSPFGKHNTKKLHMPDARLTPTSPRRCPRCKQVKPVEEFYNRRGVQFSSVYCKSCTNEQTTERTKQIKREAVAYKGGKCQCCGYSDCVAAMDFHHIDPTQKDFTIIQLRTISLEKIKPELDKCLLVCCRCHREIEAGFRLASPAGLEPARSLSTTRD